MGIDAGAAPAAQTAHFVDRVLVDLRHELLTRGNSLATIGAIDRGLEIQVHSILTETSAALAGDEPLEPVQVSVDYADPESLARHGEEAGRRDRDPAEPLMAAELLFDLALPLLVDEFPSQDPVTVARVLHRSIWRRFPPGAIAYVRILRERLAAAQLETRRRLSHDLHDEVGNGIAAAMQRLESEGGSSEVLISARDVLASVLASTQRLIGELRESTETLDEAIQSLCARFGTDLAIAFSTSGTPRPLTATVVEGVCAIAREALNNARKHAIDATRVSVTVQWAEDGVMVAVEDDGRSSDPEIGPDGLGLRGMRERASALGAELTVSFRSGGHVGLDLPYFSARASA